LLIIANNSGILARLKTYAFEKSVLLNGLPSRFIKSKQFSFSIKYNNGDLLRGFPIDKAIIQLEKVTE